MAAQNRNTSNQQLNEELDEPWKGRVLYTGPDDLRDHRVTVEDEHRYVGIGTMTREGTSEVDYLWRAATTTPHPRPMSHRVGAVGWGIPQMNDWNVVSSGRQIVIGEFRQECEHRHTHLYQNSWYPGPGEYIKQGSDASQVMNVYRPRTTASGQRPAGNRGAGATDRNSDDSRENNQQYQSTGEQAVAVS